MGADVHIVIVSHDSQHELQLCLEHLSQQTDEITSIVLVDSGSKDTSYLSKLKSKHPLKVIRQNNIGFSRANNLGFKAIDGSWGSLVIFLNPDAFLEPDFIHKLQRVFTKQPGKTCVSGKLLSFDLGRMVPTARIDSTGVYRKWYGRWYDRGQAQIDNGQFDAVAEPAALCGALLCFRYNDLVSLGEDVFDPEFFLYKEDIELGIRLRKSGWKLLYDPSLLAYHCRGWKKNRNRVQFKLKVMSAKNELLLYKKHPSPYICWAFLKYILVSLLRI